MGLRHFEDPGGIIAVFGVPSAAGIARLGLYAIQHLGEHTVGIVSCDAGGQHYKAGEGWVSQYFTERRIVELPGNAAIGYVGPPVRLPKPGDIQPYHVQYRWGSLSMAHTGHLVGTDEIKKALTEDGAIFRTQSAQSAIEVVHHLVARSPRRTFRGRLQGALEQIAGAFTLVALHYNEQDGCEMVVARDPHGIQTACMGRLANGALVFASETCVFDLIGAEYIRELFPGEMVHVSQGDVSYDFPMEQRRTLLCVFAPLYFNRPDSIVFEKYSGDVRQALGRALADVAPVAADVVVPVPDSGLSYGLGYARASGVPFEMAFLRSHYIGNSRMTEPSEDVPGFGSRLKWGLVKGAVEGKVVVAVDNAPVSGDTAQRLTERLRGAGAKEIHWRFGAPLITSSCMCLSVPPEVFLSAKTPEEMRFWLGADSVAFLPLETLEEVLRHELGTDSFCYGRFTGRKPFEGPIGK